MRGPVPLLFVFLAAIIATFGSDLHAQVYAQASVHIQSGQVQFSCETQGEGSYVQSNNLGVDLFCSATVDVNWTCTGGVSTTSPWDKTCSGPGSQSVVPGQRYTLTGQHYIDFEYAPPSLCTTTYYDNDGFLQLATQDCNGSCDVPGPGLQDTCTNLPDYEVIQTTAWDTAILVSPQQVTLGQSQTETFSTNWSPADQVVWSIASGPGTISATGLYTAPSNIANAQTAVVKACVSTESLNCNTATVNLKPPAPTITGIAVNGVANAPLLANTTQTVTLTGTNFGSTAPTITVETSDGGYVTVGAVTSYTAQTAVSFSVTTALLAPNGTASFELTAPGGNVTSPSIAVHQIVLPAPQIMMVTSAANLQSCTGGTEIDGQTTPVYAGQLILLCSPAPTLPTGVTVTSSTWTPGNIADLSGGFCAPLGVPPAAVLPCPGNPATGGELRNPVMSGAGVTTLAFFWVVPDNLETMTYTYCVNNSTTVCATSLVATFDASGPTGNLVPNACVGTGNVSVVIDTTTYAPNIAMRMGNAQGISANGVYINDLATLPRGSFTFAQIISSVTYSQLYTPTQGYTPPSNVGLGLDGGYPYPPYSRNTFSVTDAPARLDLYSYVGEVGKAFDATMYVMWDPAIPPVGQNTCTPASVNTNTGLGQPYIYIPSTCASIPVPLGSVEWEWAGCAIDTLAPTGNGTSWSIQCGNAVAYISDEAVYPNWTTCDSSLYGTCQD